MKVNSPDSSLWEVEAVHIVPHSSKGKDDILNAMALCRLHHWAFDVGWFALRDDFSIYVSECVNSLPSNFGRMGEYDFIRIFARKRYKMILPKRKEIYPHQNSIRWHRDNIFYPKLNIL